MDMQSLGRILLVIGIGIAIVGAVIMIAPRLPFLSQLGNLPGDLRIQNENFTCLVPIVSSILISIIATIVINIIIRLLNRP
ncbi:MAG: DUF2905 domain-containing protein [Chloroflexota bacterium]|nr:DUF2905 domain-containing protein [Chloroflexota bacterium]